MKSLIVLLGPTGVGKTELSLALAERLGSPIISADSRQIYKRIKIGTAAPSDEQLARVKHYFVHSLELGEYYSAAEYEKDVLDLLDGLFKEYNNVVLTGGSMMYIDAVTKGIDDIPTIDDDTRQMLKHRLEVDGLDVLLEELRILDPEYYKIVDKKNHKRVVHALEICYMTGKTFTSFRTNQVKQRPFRIVKFGLRRERTDLFDRINKRVEQMMADGLLEEARSVYGLRDLNSLNTVGYKEMFRVLSGEWELPMAVERMKKNTRVYAKKQMTWFNHDNNIQWLDADKLTTDEMLNKIMQDIR
jgi:tRNA dimethylallyltransferase